MLPGNYAIYLRLFFDRHVGEPIIKYPVMQPGDESTNGHLQRTLNSTFKIYVRYNRFLNHSQRLHVNLDSQCHF